MKLPTRLATALGALDAGLVALLFQTNASHTLKELGAVIGTFVAAWLIHPDEAGTTTPPTPVTRPDTAVRPDGALPSAPPEA
jgi:hypothetical protein